jgi:hypothetical protein
MARPDLRLQQRSMWLAYPMDLLDPAGQLLGMLDWPGGGGATGDRAKPRELPLDLRGRRYRITQTTLPKAGTATCACSCGVPVPRRWPASTSRRPTAMVRACS